MQNSLNCCTWQNLDGGQKKSSLYSGPESAPDFFKSSHFGSIQLRPLEPSHHVRGDYFIADLFPRDLIRFNWYMK